MRCSTASAEPFSSPTSARASSPRPKAIRSSSSSSSHSALEGGLADRQLPETIQALLAARLDRLGPGERAVLERAAVIGKRVRPGRCRRASRPRGRTHGRCSCPGTRRAGLHPARRRRPPLPARPGAGGRLPRCAEEAQGRAARALHRSVRAAVRRHRRRRRVRRLPPRAGVPAAHRARRVRSAARSSSPRTRGAGSAEAGIRATQAW